MSNRSTLADWTPAAGSAHPAAASGVEPILLQDRSTKLLPAASLFGLPPATRSSNRYFTAALGDTCRSTFSYPQSSTPQALAAQTVPPTLREGSSPQQLQQAGIPTALSTHPRSSLQSIAAALPAIPQPSPFPQHMQCPRSPQSTSTRKHLSYSITQGGDIVCPQSSTNDEPAAFALPTASLCPRSSFGLPPQACGLPPPLTSLAARSRVLYISARSRFIVPHLAAATNCFWPQILLFPAAEAQTRSSHTHCFPQRCKRSPAAKSSGRSDELLLAATSDYRRSFALDRSFACVDPQPGHAAAMSFAGSVEHSTAELRHFRSLAVALPQS